MKINMEIELSDVDRRYIEVAQSFSKTMFLVSSMGFDDTGWISSNGTTMNGDLTPYQSAYNNMELMLQMAFPCRPDMVRRLIDLHLETYEPFEWLITEHAARIICSDI